MPAEVPQLAGTAMELQLGEFREASFLKFLLRDAGVVALSCRRAAA